VTLSVTTNAFVGICTDKGDCMFVTYKLDIPYMLENSPHGENVWGNSRYGMVY